MLQSHWPHLYKPCSGQVQRLHFFQSKEQVERKEKEALLQESQKTREELKTRAQEALRQWRAKCRRLQKELEEERAQTQLQMDKAAQVCWTTCLHRTFFTFVLMKW